MIYNIEEMPNMTRANRVRRMLGKHNRTLKRGVGSRNLFAPPENRRNNLNYRSTSNASNTMMRLRFNNNNNTPSNNNANKMFKNIMADRGRHRYTNRNVNFLTRSVV